MVKQPISEKVNQNVKLDLLRLIIDLLSNPAPGRGVG